LGVRGARLAFLLLTTAWLVLLLGAPINAAGAPLSALTYLFGSAICHQRPERSFHVGPAQLPVCARCFGLYAGAALGATAALALRPATRRQARFLIVACGAPTLITWGGELLGVWFPANGTRFIAALPLGLAVALTVNYIECARPPRTGPSPPRIPI
jgi:uncharacterized membrane protein